VTNVDFRDMAFVNILADNAHPEYAKAQDFMINLALCHTVITELSDGKLEYNASSPDELALLNFAKYLGYEFLGIDDNNFMEI